MPEIANGTQTSHKSPCAVPFSSLIGNMSIVCQILIQDDSQQRKKIIQCRDNLCFYLMIYVLPPLCVIECHYMASRNNQAGKSITRALAGSTAR